MKPGSAGFVEDGGDVGPFEGGAGVDGNAKGGVLAADLQRLGKDAGEGVGKEVKSSNGRFRGLSRERVALLGALEVHNMGRNGRRGKIVQAFVETDMLGCLDSVSFGIVPEDVLGRAGEETEEGAFLGVGHKLGRALAGGGGPRLGNQRCESRQSHPVCQWPIVLEQILGRGRQENCRSGGSGGKSRAKI